MIGWHPRINLVAYPSFCKCVENCVKPPPHSLYRTMIMPCATALSSKLIVTGSPENFIKTHSRKHYRIFAIVFLRDMGLTTLLATPRRHTMYHFFGKLFLFVQDGVPIGIHKADRLQKYFVIRKVNTLGLQGSGAVGTATWQNIRFSCIKIYGIACIL